jgi:RNA polymerase sigma factor for flagellar operon FliA
MADGRELDALWEQWKRGRSLEAREDLLVAYLPLVQGALSRLRHALPAEAGRQLADDLKNAGVLGLMEAFEHFREGHGASFPTFASHRIRGAMLDELRRQDWISKQRRQRWKSLQAALRRAEQRLGRGASEAELAGEAGMSVEALRQELLELGPASLVFLDGLEGGGEDALGRFHHPILKPSGPEELALRQRTLERLAALIEALPENERLVVTLAAYEELSHKEIARLLGISAPRVSQIYARAVLRLQAGLQGQGQQL